MLIWKKKERPPKNVWKKLPKIRKEAKKTGESLFKMSDYGNKIYSFFTKIS